MTVKDEAVIHNKMVYAPWCTNLLVTGGELNNMFTSKQHKTDKENILQCTFSHQYLNFFNFIIPQYLALFENLSWDIFFTCLLLHK